MEKCLIRTRCMFRKGVQVFCAVRVDALKIFAQNKDRYIGSHKSRVVINSNESSQKLVKNLGY